MRVFKTDSGLSFNVRQDKCCVFCKHCEHILYDIHGPYMISCEKTSKYAIEHNCNGKCELFEDVCTESNIILDVLKAIKDECAATEECSICPFNISNNYYYDYCIFQGISAYEGRTPEDWEIEKIKFEEGGVHGQ